MTADDIARLVIENEDDTRPVALLSKDAAEQVIDLMTRDMGREDLLVDDLRGHVADMGLGRMVHHPLVVLLPPVSPHMANHLYAERTAALADAERRKDWDRWINIHEKPYRLVKLVQLVGDGKITKRQFARLLPPTWSICEPDDTDPAYLDLFRTATAALGRRVETGDKLPAGKTLTVYRGQKPAARRGISWSLNPEIGAFFARRFGGNGVVLTGEVDRADILAYITDRGESEIIVDPKRVRERRN